MTDGAFARERALFDAALEAGPERREEILAARAAEDPGLVLRVRALLAADAEASPRLFAGGAPSALVPGSRFAGFRILRELGRGGQGVVHLAEDERLGRRVALKALSGLAASDAGARARFAREAAGLARLDHPAAVKVYEAGEVDGLPYLAMQYVDGPSAAACVSAAARGEATPLHPRGGPPRGPEDVARLLASVEGVARALHAAHAAGLLHRDVKPANLLVAPDGAMLLADFGLVADAAPGGGPTRTGDVVGTPSYVAPERLDGSAPRATVGADVFALGAALYELLVLRRAFDGPTPEAALRAVLDAEPVPPRRLLPFLARDVETVVLRALEKDPGRRYADALAFADDLAAARTGGAIAARRRGPIARAVARARRRPAAAAAVVVVVLLAGAVVALAVRAAADAPRVAAERAREDAATAKSLTASARLALFAGEAEAAAARCREALGLDPTATEALALLCAALTTDAAAIDAALRGHPAALAGSTLLSAWAAGPPGVVRRRIPEFDAPEARSFTAVDDLIAASVALSHHRGTHAPGAAADALRYARRAVVSTPAPSLAAALLFAETAVAARDATAGGEAAALLRRRWPDSPDAAAAGALAASAAPAPEGTLAAADALLAAAADDRVAPELAYTLAARASGLGRQEEAYAAMGRAADRSSAGSRLRGAFALVESESGDPVAAEARARALLERPERRAYGVMALASALRRQGRAAEAVPVLDAELARAPGSLTFLRERARIFIALDRLDDARRDLEPLKAARANDPDFLALWREVADDDE